MGTQSPSQNRGGAPSPIFGPFLLWPNGSMHQDATWYGCWPQHRGLCVRWRPSLPSQTKLFRFLGLRLQNPVFPKSGGNPPPQFSAHFYCGQTARCIKRPLGMDVGLSPGNYVLDGDLVLPPQQRGQNPLPIFGPFLLCHSVWRLSLIHI